MTFLQSTSVATQQWTLGESQENNLDKEIGNNSWLGERIGWGRLTNMDKLKKLKKKEREEEARSIA